MKRFTVLVVVFALMSGAIAPTGHPFTVFSGGEAPIPDSCKTNQHVRAGLMPASVADKKIYKKEGTLHYVNRPEVLLEYELAKVGQHGVGCVDVWWTRNGGLCWDLYALTSDINGSTFNGKRLVELPGEGEYGFILLVKNRAGLGKPPPISGEIPEIRVEVDTVPPVVQVYSPDPDRQRPGALLLKWTAKDKNLTTTPITWEWAERREGPWKPIVFDIPNTGKYSWQLPNVLPLKVYLRVKVRDLAGNETVAVTPEPQLIDLSEPEGRLVNVTVPRRP